MRRIIVRDSPVHGKGVFALRPIPAAKRILEYKGEIIQRPPSNENGHTFLFGLSDGRVIDGGRGGNSARWLNHACAPNCLAIEDNGRVFIETMTAIQAGDELFIDYALDVEGQQTEEMRALYACKCGTADCRGTMLARRE